MRLVWVPTAVEDAVLEDCLADLPAGEHPRERTNVPVQRRRVVAHAVLRRLLGERLRLAPARVRLTRQRWGKPVLDTRGAGEADTPIHFSLSYSGDAALLALSSAPVGVDVERVIPPDAAQVARHVYAEPECERLHGAPAGQADQTFLDIWTAKEAVLKWLGLGFRGEPRKFCVPPTSPDFQPVCVAALAPHTSSCVVASWRLAQGDTVALSLAAAPSSMTWEHYAH